MNGSVIGTQANKPTDRETHVSSVVYEVLSMHKNTKAESAIKNSQQYNIP